MNERRMPVMVYVLRISGAVVLVLALVLGAFALGLTGESAGARAPSSLLGGIAASLWRWTFVGGLAAGFAGLLFLAAATGLALLADIRFYHARAARMATRAPDEDKALPMRAAAPVAKAAGAKGAERGERDVGAGARRQDRPRAGKPPASGKAMSERMPAHVSAAPREPRL